MLHRKNKDLHVVRDPEAEADKLVEQIITELNNEELTVEDIEKEVEDHKKKRRRQAIIGTSIAVVAVVSIFLFIHFQTYSEARVSDTYEVTSVVDGNYEAFENGVLKYSRDGVAFLNRRGEEQWNQPAQMKNPFAYVQGASAVIADKGGNEILVFQENGLLGEISTTLPIEKVSVSEQGIVCAILNNESTPQIICYDAAGNILVEHRASLSGTGYPLDATISPNGELLQVEYLYTQESSITSKVIYYNFGEAGEDKTDKQVASWDYDGTIAATGFFLGQSASVVVGDDKLVFYRGGDIPEERQVVEIDKEIKSAFHDDSYVGLILRNEGEEGYEMRLYSASGRQIQSQNFTGDYSHVKLSSGQVIMYEGRQCCIFLRSGVQKFEGEFENNILELFPVLGVNNYIVMNANGMEHVRLVK